MSVQSIVEQVPRAASDENLQNLGQQEILYKISRQHRKRV